MRAVVAGISSNWSDEALLQRENSTCNVFMSSSTVRCLILGNTALYCVKNISEAQVCFLRGSLLGLSWTDESLQYVCSVLLALVQLKCESLVWTIGYVLGVMLGKDETKHEIQELYKETNTFGVKTSQSSNKFIQYFLSRSRTVIIVCF